MRETPCRHDGWALREKIVRSHVSHSQDILTDMIVHVDARERPRADQSRDRVLRSVHTSRGITIYLRRAPVDELDSARRIALEQEIAGLYVAVDKVMGVDIFQRVSLCGTLHVNVHTRRNSGTDHLTREGDEVAHRQPRRALRRFIDV